MEILTAQQMKKTDTFAISRGYTESVLIENAGFAAACVIAPFFKKRPVCILCGTGNNGADGFVCARILKNFGWNVRVLLFGAPDKMRPAAFEKYTAFEGDVYPFDMERLTKAVSQNALFADALFGTGLTRALPPEISEAFEFLNKNNAVCTALDVPSGVNADTGALCPVCLKCALTVTFCRHKPASFLYPAKAFFGKTVLRDAGLPNEAVAQAEPFLETIDKDTKMPAAPDWRDHKHTRGGAVVVGGEMTGAGRLAALAALNAGAGLVAVACPRKSADIYAQNPAFVLKPCDDEKALMSVLTDKKIRSVAIGMGLGNGTSARTAADAVFLSGKPCVFDADALRFLKGKVFTAPAVLTPHAGEFSALFPDVLNGSKIDRALQAAKRMNAVVVFKGADTVVAAPDGRAALNTNAPFSLATAGSGDVLAGIIAAYLANGLSAFDAAKAAVFTHSQAALHAKTPLTSTDLITAIQAV